ncbi:hypothetical protein MGN70_008102 [Eutypa lata]|nr:hypothetical protein MGN70_008102 [Eutypa lata]
MLAQHQVENMTYQQSAYSEAMPFQTYMDGAAMDAAGNNLIDPDLKASMSPTHAGNLCDPPQMQRFLSDSCNSTYIGHQQIDPKFQGPLASTTSNGVAPIPSALPHRQASPPFTHPSSTCSSVLSPTMESDYYHAASPPTPTDSQIWSTSFSSPYENFSSHSQLYQYTGLADDCVKPIDVNPYQDTPHGLPYEDSTGRSLLMRGLSMSSDDSCSNADQWSPPELSHMPQPMSPDTHTPEVKEEIHIAESPSYPPLGPDDEAHSADEVEHPNVKIEDEDEEYQPTKRTRRPNPHPSRASKASKRACSSHTSHAKRIKTEPNNALGNIATNKASLKGTKRNFPCKECRDITFKDENGLLKHIKAQHTRPFICVFHFAGCKSTFASKNEWKRHCSSQHLLLNYWLCQQDQCAKVSNSHTSTKSSASWQGQCGSPHNGSEGIPALPNGAIFNRKDLYTQHLRRMHVPPNVKKQVKQKKSVPEWEDNERTYQDQAHRTRCHLPNRMDCPAPGCKIEFEGPSAWDERMEHVAKHLDKVGLGVEMPIEFGGDHDATLIEWATRPEVSIIRRDDKGGWELHNPLRPTGHPRKGMTAADEDEDAEGEEFDE